MGAIVGITNIIIDPEHPSAGDNVYVTVDILAKQNTYVLLKIYFGDTEIINECYNPDLNASCDVLSRDSTWSVTTPAQDVPDTGFKITAKVWYWNSAAWVLDDERALCFPGFIVGFESSDVHGSIKVYRNCQTAGGVDCDVPETIRSPTWYHFYDWEIVKLEAIPDTGYNFLKWCDQLNVCNGGSNPISFVPPCVDYIGARYAYFIDNATALNLEVKREQGSGFVNVYQNDGLIGILSESETSQTFQFNSGDVYKLESVPSTGYIFLKWCDQNGCTTNADLIGTITSDQTGSNAKKIYFIDGHTECVDNICKYVVGSGEDQCTAGNTCEGGTPTSISLHVNGEIDKINIPKNESFRVQFTGDSSEDYWVKDIAPLPDVDLYKRRTNSTGVDEHELRYDTDVTLELQAYQDCGALSCDKRSNTIIVIIGKGSCNWYDIGCLIGKPLGITSWMVYAIIAVIIILILIVILKR